MGPLSLFQTVFSLDTLDYRLTAGTSHSSSSPKTPTVSSPSGPSTASTESPLSRKTREEASPSRWKTAEYFLYYFVFVTVIPMMFKKAYDVSKGLCGVGKKIQSHPNFPKYKHLLSPGWIPGRRVDNSDNQYSSFRDNIPILFFVLALHFALRRLFDLLYSRISPSPPRNSSYLPVHNLNRRKIFDVIFALIFLTVLHSLSIIKILFILILNFSISYFHPSSILVPILTWVINIAVLFANEYFRGYRFRDILPFLVAGEGSGVGYWMDHFLGGGILNRWEVSFNITVLRLISYNMDYHWAAVRLEEGEMEPGSVIEVGRLVSVVQGEAADLERMPEDGEDQLSESAVASREGRLIINAELKKKYADPANVSERDRVNTPAKIEDYSLLNYLAYALYTPLYLAGPIITFNDFIHQQKYSTPTLTIRRTFFYAIRLLVAIFSMEVALHFLYVVAISKTASRGSWENDTPAQLAMIGYFNLHIIWLKLLIPWRFFRLWALLDGVDPPENMLRCMSNNYSALAFWRAWHRSFNRWIVRYIYIPIGGAQRPIINMIAVFTFVALWHDLSLKLLAWGWLIVLFVIPEIVARKVFSPRRFVGRENLYRHLSAVGGVANVLMMMAANLVGFAIGLDGLKQMIAGLFGSFDGIGFLLLALSSVFIAVHVMMEVRESEKRMGVLLKC